MKRDKREKLDKTAKKLRESPFIKDLSYRYPTEIFPDGNLLVAREGLRDAHGKQVDLIEIEMNEEGLVNVEQVLDLVVTVWEMGLHNAEWEEAMERIRQMKF